MGKLIDLTGMRFRKLVVIKNVGKIKDRWCWLCKCDCGNEKVMPGEFLRNKGIKSCGCASQDFYKSKFIDLSDKIFGRLTILKLDHKGERGYFWLCRCECGKEKIILHYNLLYGLTRSCGCFNKNRLGNGITSFNSLYDIYKQNAKKRNMSFELDKETFMALTKKKCFYCGQEPTNIINTSVNGSYVYNGVDRLNSSLGYFIGNVVSCCFRCNSAKMALSLQEFYDWVKKVYNYSFGDKVNDQ